MKLFLFIGVAFGSALGGARDIDLGGIPQSATEYRSVLETLMFSRTDSLSKEDEPSDESKSETDSEQPHTLSQKLIEEVEDPSSIDSIQKGFYIDEQLLDADMGKSAKRTEEIENNRNKTGDNLELGPNSIADILGASESQGERALFAEESEFLSKEDFFSVEDEEPVDESLL